MKSCPLLKGALASLLISHGATSWARADEPGRFLLVEGWRGTFTQGLTLQGSGILTGSSEICQVDYSYVHRLNASHIVFWTQGAFGTSRYWITDYQQGNAGSFAERHTVDCPLPEPLTHTGTGASMAGVFLLQVDTAANQYTLQFPELIVTLAVND